MVGVAEAQGLEVESCLVSAMWASDHPIADEIDYDVWALPPCLLTTCQIRLTCLCCGLRAAGGVASRARQLCERLHLASLGALGGEIQPDPETDEESNDNGDEQCHDVR